MAAIPNTLRWAIAQADATEVNFNLAAANRTITLVGNNNPLTIQRSIIISGPLDNPMLTVQGNANTGVFDIRHVPNILVVLIRLRITGGNAQDGGGIHNHGRLILENCRIDHNTARGFGGGIFNTGRMNIVDTTIEENTARDGGGISNRGPKQDRPAGQITLDHVTIRNNHANQRDGRGGTGGGIRNRGMIQLSFNVTISGNTANMGAGVYNVQGSTLNLGSSTIADNVVRNGPPGPPGLGGGIFVEPGASVSIVNTIVAANTQADQPDDVSGAVASRGHNLIGDGTNGSGFVSTDLVGNSANPIDPRLGPLQDNGGFTWTQALLPDSPGIDAGDNAYAPATDQRGLTRIVDGVVDIGAFEYGATAAPTQPQAVYSFGDTLASDTSGAPALAAVDPLGRNHFEAANVDGVTRRVYRFDGNADPATQQGGLALDTTGLIPANSYSFEMYIELDSALGWRRLIDVQGRQSDDGFYVDPDGFLDVYPVGNGALPFSAGAFLHVVLTVAPSGQVRGYLDGVPDFTISSTDVMNVNNPTGVMNFFLDNLVPPYTDEYSTGRIALLRVYRGVLSDEEVAARAESPFADASPPSPAAGHDLQGHRADAAVGLALGGLGLRPTGDASRAGQTTGTVDPRLSPWHGARSPAGRGYLEAMLPAGENGLSDTQGAEPLVGAVSHSRNLAGDAALELDSFYAAPNLFASDSSVVPVRLATP
jgi:hypothetical protein